MTVADSLPLTAAQYGIWLGQQLDPGSPAYWTAELVELNGSIDEAAFERALRQAIGECDALHQRFAVHGDAVHQRCVRADRWPLVRLAVDDEGARAWIEDDLARHADLASGPLFATALLRLSPTRHQWYLRAHHIALDGFGYTLLSNRVAALYSAMTGGAAAPPARPAALAPVVEEDAAYAASAAYDTDRAFWTGRMAHSTPVLLAPPAPVARSVLRQRGQLEEQAYGKWQAAAHAAGTDWSALVVAMFAAWLQRESGAREVVIGLPVMGRLGSSALTVPCMAMNIIPLRLAVNPGEPLASLARRAADEMRRTRRHQRFRYEHLKQVLGMAGGRQRLFGAVINLMPFDRPPAFGSLAAVSKPLSAGAVEDLSFTVAPGPSGVRCDLEANPNAYQGEQLAKLHGRLLRAMEALAAAPDVPLAQVLGERQRATAAGPALAAPPVDVLDALLRHAHSHRVAVEHDGIGIDYAALLAQVKAIAGILRDRGVGNESRVALLLPREARTIAAMLGVLWAGGAYIPLDPSGPRVRTESVLAEAAPELVVTLRAHAALAGSLPALLLDEVAAGTPMSDPMPVSASALAYVIYTSGSTGRPNGVMIERGALAHFVAAAGSRYQMAESDRMLQFAPLHFDASIEEIYLPLCTGATLVLRTDAMLESVPRFLDTCANLGITVLDLPTAYWHELAYSAGRQQAAVPACIRLLIIGGEAALAARLADWQRAAPRAVLLNTYGPTEATVICTTAPLAGGEPHIGTALPGVAIAVVDNELRLVGLGQEGELCLLGPTLARGYLGRPEVTARRFVPLAALAGSPRAYRTGDRVVLGEDGNLRYLGRLDDELKISGQRVDPLEIEAALLAHPAVREAAVVFNGTGLTAFVAAAGTAVPSLRGWVSERVTPAAVPACWDLRQSLPRNHNGKIDRSALRAEAGRPAAASGAPATGLEQTVMAVWREVLGIGVVAPADDFFALGGQSLQAIQVANRLGVALGRDVAMSALFRHPTVSSLAAALAGLAGHAPPAHVLGAEYAPLLTIQAGSGPALFCIHPAEGLSWCYLGLTRHLPDMPIYGLQARGLTGDAPASAAEMADDYLALIRAAQPQGPYRLLGWSSGGGIAHAIAVRLRRMGERVTLLAMMDAYPSHIWEGRPQAQERDALVAMLDVVGASDRDDAGQPLARDAIMAALRRPGSALAAASDEQIGRMVSTSLHTMHAYRGLRHEVFDGGLLFFHASERRPDAPDYRGWAPYIGGRIDKINIASNHNTMSQPAPLAHIGRELAARLTNKDAA